MYTRKKPANPRTLNKVNNSTSMTFEEILREYALHYLPAKSLYRCNAVCRDWKLLISNPVFKHNQSYFFRSLSGLFCQPHNGSIAFISLDPMAYGIPEMNFLPEPVDLLASSNGLLCCRGRLEHKPYYIFNPVNKNWKELPKPEADHGSIPTLVLVFHPSLLDLFADYKLVFAFPSPDFDDAFEFEIYSSNDNSWKISPEICFGEPTRVLDRNGLHLNGVVYWLCNDSYLLSFDLKKNRATLIPGYDATPGPYLGAIDGKPCVSHREDQQLIVSVLSDVNGNTMQMSYEENIWEKQYMAIEHAKMSPDVNPYERTVLTMGSDLIVFHDGWTIFSYNRKTKETKSIGNDLAYETDCVYLPYVNSLVRLQ